MKKRLAASLAVLGVVLVAGLAIVWQAVRAQSALATNPFVEGISDTTLSSGGVSLYARQAGGEYANIRFSPVAPYGLLSSISALNQLLAPGLKALAAAPAGPAGIGRQSQIFAMENLDGNGSVGAALVNVSGVNVYEGTTGLSFHMLVYYQMGGDVNSVSFTDLNADGLPDLVAAFDGDGAPGGIAVRLNKGDGTFATENVYASGTFATHFAILDLNHDGVPDIATVSLDQMVTILLGKGDGTFGSPLKYSIGSGPTGGSGQAITIADFNGDGNPDLAVGGATGIFLGNGDGTFRPGTALPGGASGTGIWTLAAGDMNGDGKMDLVCADIMNQVVFPLLGKGDGTFQSGQAYVVSQYPDSLVLTDYNNDGHLDIIDGNGDQRGFGPADQSGNVDILLGNGDGTFQGAPAYFTLPSQAGGGFTLVNGIAAGNFGGALGSILASGGGGVTLFPGNGKGGLLPPQTIAVAGTAMAAGDFNGDGKADAAVASGAVVTILLSSGTGLVQGSTPASGGSAATAVATADFNGDGKLDLAVMNSGSPGTLAIFKGNGDGTFQPAVSIPAGATPTSLAAADINGDGKPDLVFADSGTNGFGGAVYVSLNAGGGVFQTPVSVFTGFYPGVGIGDVNGDGRLDLVVGAQSGGGNALASWMQGNGNGTFQAPVAIATSTANDTSILVQDFNGDGHVDLLLAHNDGGTGFLAGNGDGTFSSELNLLGPYQPSLLLSTDLNGDGKPDVLVGGSTVTVLLNAGVPTVSTENSASFTTAIAPGSIASAFGTDLANGSTALNTTMTLTDSSGLAQPCTLFYVSAPQLNFLIPANAATGPATLTVQSGDGTVSKGALTLTTVGPGLYTANGTLASAIAVTATPGGSQSSTILVSANSSGTLVTAPISLDPPANTVVLLLYGTGIRGAALSQVSVKVAGQTIVPAYAGAAPGFPGEDQVNVQLPYSLKGTGDTAITLTAAGQQSNTVHVLIQ